MAEAGGRAEGGRRDGARQRVRYWATIWTMMLATAAAQIPGMGGEKTKAPVMKEDLKFIRCATCEELAKTLHRDIKTMRDELPAHIKKVWRRLAHLTSVEILVSP